MSDHPEVGEPHSGGSTPKISRSEQNRINRETKGGQSRNPLYELCRAIQRHRRFPICYEFSSDAPRLHGVDGLDRFMETVQRTIGPRPTKRSWLMPIDCDRGFTPGNMAWVERGASRKEMEAADRAADMLSCLCDWRARQGCACPWASLVAAGLMEDAESVTPYPDDQ